MAKQIQKQAQEVETVVETSRAKQVREMIKKLSKGIEDNYLDLSQLIAEAIHNEYYRAWGFTGDDAFDQYCEQELDVDYRKMRYLASIWTTVEGLALPKEQIKKLGWTKMKDLAVVITKKNAAKLLKEAGKMSTREVTAMVKKMRPAEGKGAARQPVTQKLTFTLGESEHKIIMEALDEAKKLCDSDNLAIALEMICQDWLTEKGTKPESTHLEDHITYLEKIYPVKISFEEVAKKKAKKEEKPKKGEKPKKERVPDEPEEEEEGEDAGDIEELLGGNKKKK